MPRKSTPAVQQPAMGQFHRQLKEPEIVGNITLAEAREIKALNDLLQKLQDEALHAQRVMQVASMHRMEFLRRLLADRGLDLKDLYNIDDDSGQIKRTHELVEPTAMEVIEGSADIGAERDGPD